MSIRTYGDYRKEVDKIMGITTPTPKPKAIVKEDKKLKNKMEMYKARYEQLLREKAQASTPKGTE